MHDTKDWPKMPAYDRAAEKLRAIALAYPEAYEDHPWGESAFKVKGKVFLFMGRHENTFGTSTKLPVSAAIALMLPFAEPTGYGLGKSGWVSARFGPKDELPYDILTAWIDESYRAVAPAKLVAALPAAGSAPTTAKKPPARKPTAAKKPAAKKRVRAPRPE